jgi:hypothetical protein
MNDFLLDDEGELGQRSTSANELERVDGEKLNPMFYQC